MVVLVVYVKMSEGRDGSSRFSGWSKWYDRRGVARKVFEKLCRRLEGSGAVLVDKADSGDVGDYARWYRLGREDYLVLHLNIDWLRPSPTRPRSEDVAKDIIGWFKRVTSLHELLSIISLLRG